MYAKTMEGLVGAKTNMDLVNTPMRVYKDARRRGDLAVMERAMGYAGEFAGKAQEYKEKAKEGMEEEAEIAREIEKLEREEAISERAEGGKEQEEETKDKVEVSEEGKALLNGSAGMGLGKPLAGVPDAAPKVLAYTKKGEASQARQAVSISVSI